jgi:hypothetical protein
LLGVSVDCLIRWRQRGEGPPFTQISARKISYDMNDLGEWLSCRRQCPKDSVAPGQGLCDAVGASITYNDEGDK